LEVEEGDKPVSAEEFRKAHRPMLEYQAERSVVSTETKRWGQGTGIGPSGWDDIGGLDERLAQRKSNTKSFSEAMKSTYCEVNAEKDGFLEEIINELDTTAKEQVVELCEVVEIYQKILSKSLVPGNSAACLEKFKYAARSAANSTMAIDRIDPGTFDVDDPRIFFKMIGQYITNNKDGAGQEDVRRRSDGRSFGNNAHDVLSDWYRKHQDHPYPERDEREKLAQQCGITTKQLANWFGNKRKRERQKKEEGGMGRPRCDSVKDGMQAMLSGMDRENSEASDASDGGSDSEDEGVEKVPWSGMAEISPTDGWMMKTVEKAGGGRPERFYYAPTGQRFSSLNTVKAFISEGILERPIKRSHGGGGVWTSSGCNLERPPKKPRHEPEKRQVSITPGTAAGEGAGPSPMLGGLSSLAGFAAVEDGEGGGRPRSDSVNSSGMSVGERERVCALCKPKHRTVEQCRRALKHMGANWNESPAMGPRIGGLLSGPLTLTLTLASYWRPPLWSWWL